MQGIRATRALTPLATPAFSFFWEPLLSGVPKCCNRPLLALTAPSFGGMVVLLGIIVEYTFLRWLKKCCVGVSPVLLQ